jgi:small conductance mechanosensitive channel
MNFTMLLQGLNWGYWITVQYELVYNAIMGSMRSLIGGFAARLPFIIAGIIVLLIFWLLSRLFRWAFLSSTRRTRMDTQLRILISRLIVVFMVVIGIFAALTVIIESFDFGQVIAGLGFTSFVVGFATKDILNNFLSGILILWQRPFNLGDYLFVGNNQGKVEHIGVRATMLRKDDGEAVLIPNGEMYSSPLTIRGAGKKRRMNLKFALGFDADLQRAKEIVLETLAKTEGVVADPKPNVYVTEFTVEGALTTVQFWIDTNENKPLKIFDRAAIEILKGLNKSGFRPFPKEGNIAGEPKESE